MTKEFFQHSAYIEAKDEFCHKKTLAKENYLNKTNMHSRL